MVLTIESQGRQDLLTEPEQVVAPAARVPGWGAPKIPADLFLLPQLWWSVLTGYNYLLKANL